MSASQSYADIKETDETSREAFMAVRIFGFGRERLQECLFFFMAAANAGRRLGPISCTPNERVYPPNKNIDKMNASVLFQCTRSIVEQRQHSIQHCGAAQTLHTALWNSANTPYSIVEQCQNSIQHCGAAQTLHTALWNSANTPYSIVELLSTTYMLLF
ncbi:hypothetical protein BgiMline_023665 [Biomphalaria glabrata]